MAIHTILVPTDLASHSVVALEHAIELAQSSAAKVYLAYVRPDVLPAVGPEPVLMPPELLHPDSSWAGLELRRLERRLLDSGTECEVGVVEGSPAAAIPDLARKLQADLIVMGTRGGGGFRRLLFGSIAERVCRSAPCPVTVVRVGLASAVSHQQLEGRA